MKEYNMTEETAQNRSVWHMKIKAGPLLHGGLYVRMQTYLVILSKDLCAWLNSGRTHHEVTAVDFAIT